YRIGDALVVERGTVIEQGVVDSLKTVAQERVAAVEEEFNKKRDDTVLMSDAALEQKRKTILEELKPLQERAGGERQTVYGEYAERIQELEEIADPAENDKMILLTEPRFKELQERYGNVFEAGMGAEALLKILDRVNVEKLREKMQLEIHSTSGQRRKKATKRLKVVESLRKSGNHPSWMVFTVLPVLPPDLRPMVQLAGGRFATSDLNDLYRRVINRNNRLKKLIELNAPEVIRHNEQRMLQEAVDALIDNNNARSGRAVAATVQLRCFNCLS